MSNPASPRYLALDVFRGLTLALMIIVNTPGGENSYAPLEHALWHGFTLTDLVFPSFLFVVGAAMSLSMKKFEAHSEAYFLKRVLKRGALIFLCGYLLYWFPFFTPDFTLAPFAHTRVMGVLQRIGLCYVFAALIVRYSGLRGAAVFSVIALTGYWWLLASFGDYTLSGNAVLKLDLALLGAPHLYHGEGIAFDPEGILSTLPSIVNVLAGYGAAVWLRQKRPLTQLAMAGAACLLLAYGWDALLPMNKKLWTSSFVVCTVGWDLIILAVLSAVIDKAGLRSGTYFFEVFGKNTLFIYVLADVAVIVLARLHVGGDMLYRWLYQTLFLSWSSPYNASLLFAVAYMLACWLVAYVMDRRKIYIKL
ncbi:Predicted acyltransferase [Duganella sacchari]|uniref:Predicted acyltransferase n=1 Tax=Duganella sacchari TaxID=551987 RepID=A0A1M7LK42_9BURK|nr:heparan-alpha-glucosaminide N-acetyltransferase domain-containing protein [Duganella sacchari]SHM78536.1 Predicted acyltransferase [Duganella sacchari]